MATNEDSKSGRIFEATVNVPHFPCLMDPYFHRYKLNFNIDILCKIAQITYWRQFEGECRGSFVTIERYLACYG
jgi:hypothetical protein